MIRFISLILPTKRVEENLKALMLMKSACLQGVTGLQGVGGVAIG